MRRNFLLFCVIGVMFLIFIFSSQAGASSHYLSNAAGRLLGVLREDENGEFYGRFLFWEWNIRQLGHITLFALLGGVTHAYLLLKQTELTEIKILKCSFLSALLCFIYGCMDEFHQYFVNGRNARFQDVLVDVVGFTAAVCAVNAAVWLYRRIRR